MTVTDPTSASYKSKQEDIVSPAKKSALDADDFMKLLAVQFQSQDPMNPMEDTAFIAQMAQFTSLEQTNSLLSEITSLRADQQRSMAASYLGHTVTVSDGEGGVITGEVKAIENSEDGPRVVIGDFSYSLYSVLLVENGSTPTVQPEAETPTDA